MEEKQRIHLNGICQSVFASEIPIKVDIKNFSTIFYSDNAKTATTRLEEYFDNLFIFTENLGDGIFRIWHKYEKKVSTAFSPDTIEYMIINEIFDEIRNENLAKEIHEVAAKIEINGRPISCKFFRIYTVEFNNSEDGDLKRDRMVDTYAYIKDSLKW